MAIKISSQNSLQSKKNLFSRLQGLAFTNFMPATINSKIEDRGSHLDLESQEILMRLRDNIDKLSDVSSRVEFMMGELSHIMKKKI